MAVDPHRIAEGVRSYPGRTDRMEPPPRDGMEGYEGRGLLAGRRALVTGGETHPG